MRDTERTGDTQRTWAGVSLRNSTESWKGSRRLSLSVAYDRKTECRIAPNCGAGSQAVAAGLDYELAQSVLWSESFCRDYAFYMCNWHPFWGMFLSHSFHPFGKRERVFIFIVGITLSLVGAIYCAQKAMAYDNVLELDFVKVALFVLVQDVMLQRLSVLDVVLAGAEQAAGIDLTDGMTGCLVGSALFLVNLLFAAALVLLLAVQFQWPDLVKYTMPQMTESDIEALWNQSSEIWIRCFLLWMFLWYPVHLMLPGVGFFVRWKTEQREKGDDDWRSRGFGSLESVELSQMYSKAAATPAVVPPLKINVLRPTESQRSHRGNELCSPMLASPQVSITVTCPRGESTNLDGLHSFKLGNFSAPSRASTTLDGLHSATPGTVSAPLRASRLPHHISAPLLSCHGPSTIEDFEDGILSSPLMDGFRPHGDAPQREGLAPSLRQRSDGMAPKTARPAAIPEDVEEAATEEGTAEHAEAEPDAPPPEEPAPAPEPEPLPKPAPAPKAKNWVPKIKTKSKDWKAARAPSAVIDLNPVDFIKELPMVVAGDKRYIKGIREEQALKLGFRILLDKWDVFNLAEPVRKKTHVMKKAMLEQLANGTRDLKSVPAHEASSAAADLKNIDVKQRLKIKVLVQDLPHKDGGPFEIFLRSMDDCILPALGRMVLGKQEDATDTKRYQQCAMEALVLLASGTAVPVPPFWAWWVEDERRVFFDIRTFQCQDAFPEAGVNEVVDYSYIDAGQDRKQRWMEWQVKHITSESDLLSLEQRRVQVAGARGLQMNGAMLAGAMSKLKKAPQ